MLLEYLRSSGVERSSGAARLALRLPGGRDGGVPADCCACSPDVPAAARKVTAAMRPITVARRFLLIVVCIFFLAPLVLRSSKRVEPNSNTVVVYDAVNHVWDDQDTSVFTSFIVVIIVTISRLWASLWRTSAE